MALNPGTLMVKDIRPGNNNLRHIGELVIFEDMLYLSADDGQTEWNFGRAMEPHRERQW